MASAPSKLASAAILLLALWIVTYWLTPAPAHNTLKISFADAPPPEAAHPPAPDAEQPAPRPEPAPVRTAPRARPPAPSSLVDVAPQEIGDRGAPEPGVIPPTFRVYVTQQGDTLQRIASRFYHSTASWRVIAKANPTVDPNRLGPGIELLIPVDPTNIQGKPTDEAEANAPPPPPEPEYTEYVVQRGDTLSEIAQALYGHATMWQRIVDANPGINPDRLRPGTTLKIPPPPAVN